LILLLNDPKRGVRKTAAWALGEIGDDRAVPALTSALEDPDAGVRTAAQEALDTIARTKAKAVTGVAVL
jgi:HEAT repeat protein